MIFKKEAFTALQYREFRLYVLTRFLITMAISFQSIIIAWKIYLLTNSKLLLGFIGLTEAVPAIGIALYGGYIADKSDKRKLYISCLIFFAALSGLLIFITHSYFLELVGLKNTVIAIYVIIFFTGIARGLAGPASFSLATFLIPKHEYQNGATWSSGAWQLGAVVGPALAGILFGFLGITTTFSIQFLLVSLSIILIFKIQPKPSTVLATNENVWKSIQEGLHFVFKNKVILSCITLDLFAVLFGGAVALLPVFAKDILHVGPQGLGLLRAMPAVGAIITMVTVAFYPIKKHVGYKLLIAVAGFGLSIIFFGISTSFVLSLFCLVIGGALDGVSVIIRHTIIQLKTPPHMRGRVAAVNSMFIGSSNEIGEFESGVTAKLMGTVPAVVFGGAMTILVVIFTYFNAPSLRTMELKSDD